MNEMPPGLRPDDPTAPDQAYTEHTRATFTLKEYQHGEPWIMVEEYDPGLPVLKAGHAFLGLQFREGVSFEVAKRFVAELNKHVDGLSYTKFVT